MSTQHTPGPWTVTETKDRTIFVDARNGDMRAHYHIARLTGSTAIGEQRPTIEANARLIAAAPRMAEFLELLTMHAATQPFDLAAWQRDARAILRDVEPPQ